MRPLRWFTLFVLISTAANVDAQDATAIWNAISQPAFDSTKYATVENVEIVRDRVHITLTKGTLQFTQPAAGVVFGAAFEGQGRIQIDPPNAMESQQLRRFTGQDKLDMQFSSATFSFTDDTFATLSKDLKWTPAPNDKLASLYQDRLKAREEVGAADVPRLLQGILSGDRERTALFVADLKTSDKGWISVTDDALDPEQIQVGRLDEWTAVITGFDVWLHFPRGNRSSSDAFQNPSALADYTVDSYQIDAAVTPQAELTATVRVHLTPQIAGERVRLFNLDSNLRIDSVKDESGNPLRFFQARERGNRNESYGDYVVISLPQATQVGKAETVEFHYAGKHVVRQVGSGSYFCQSALWYPLPDYQSGTDFAARSNFEMTFHAPKQFTLVATGAKTGETSDGKIIVTKWKNEKPVSVAGFAFGDFKIFSGSAGSVAVDVYANRQPDDRLAGLQQAVDNQLRPEGSSQITAPIGSLSPSTMAKQMNGEVANAMRLFQDYYGPAPYSHIAVTDIPYSYGQGWPMLLYLSTLSFLDSTQRHMLGIQDQLAFSDFFRAHEVSHQWWGHRVGWKSYHDQWLSEGFAQFSGNLYIQFRENWKEYVNRLQIDKTELSATDLHSHTFESEGPIWMGSRLASADSERAYDVVVYDKGGLVLNMLRMLLYDPGDKDPDTRFKTMMQDFTQTFDNKAASTEDFKSIVEKHMIPRMDMDGNQRMDWFFNQYVYGTGFAEYSLNSQIRDAGNGKWEISGTINRSGVPDGWEDALPLSVHSSGRVIPIGWVRVHQNAAPFKTTIPLKPDKVILNENNEILASVK